MTKTMTTTNRFDAVKWCVFVLLLAAGVVANAHFSSQALVIRLAVGLVLLSVCVLLALQTAHGQNAWQFVKDARSEMRKVVWPDRQHVVRTTLIIVAVVIVLSMLLWGIDSVMLIAARWFTGQGG